MHSAFTDQDRSLRPTPVGTLQNCLFRPCAGCSEKWDMPPNRAPYCTENSSNDVQRFERHLEDELFTLHEELASGAYCHRPYQQFHIHDPKCRVIHKASVRDRIVHHAVHRVVAPVMERSFIFDSYSCRIGKGTHAAVRRLEIFARRVSRNWAGPCWALKCDIN